MMKAFDASVMFDNPEDTAEGAAALQASGYELTLNPDLKDEYEGTVLTPTVFGVIRGMMDQGLTEDEIAGELEAIVDPFNGLVEEVGYASPDSCCKYDPRYDEIVRARALKRQDGPDRSGDVETPAGQAGPRLPAIAIWEKFGGSAGRNSG
jgi:hypothetical protein